MRRWITCFAVVFSTAVCSSAGWAANVAAPEEFAKIKAFVEERVAAGEVPSVAVAVMKDGEVVWAEGFGTADLDAKTPATADTMYWLASVSKPITGTGLMIAKDRGFVELDAPANRYLTKSKVQSAFGSADEITLRRLGNHTSGFPLHYNFFYNGVAPPPMDETIRRYAFAAWKPGTHYQYSNLGFGILNYVTEIVSKTPWPEFMRKNLYVPLGMTHTAVGVPAELKAYGAVPYTKDVGGRFVQVGLYDFDHPGASAIWSSAHDLARFLMMHMNGGELDGVRVLSESSAAEMHKSTDKVSPRYSVGWGTAKVFGHEALTHTGGMPGVSTMVRAWPEAKAGLVVLTNGDGHGVTGAVAQSIGSHLFPDAKGPGPTIDVPSSTNPDRFIGRWKGKLVHFDGDIPIELEVEGRKSAGIRFGTARRSGVKDLAFDRNTLTGEFRGKIRTQPSFHGTCNIRLRLTVDEDRMTGVGIAMADGYFALSHWMELKKVSEEAP